MAQPSHKEKVPLYNPSSSRRLALLFETIVKSALVLYIYIFFVIENIISARFNFYKLAHECMFVRFFKVNKENKLFVLSLLFLQFLCCTSCVFLFINNYLSRGSPLPNSILKNTNLKGKLALVTGGYSGIGYETVLQLLKWNCKVVICGRNKTKATNAIEKLKASASFNENDLKFIEVDLDDLTSVKNAANKFLKEHSRLDFLINNAGIWSNRVKTTSSGLESQFSSNFLGHFYLTKLLLDAVKKCDGRILNVSSIAHFKYNPKTDPIFEKKTTTGLVEKRFNTYYGRSKLYNIWFTHALHRRLKFENKKVLVLSLQPGVINTPLLWTLNNAHFYLVPRYLNLLIVKRPVDGAATSLYLCAQPAKLLSNGSHYGERKVALVSKYAHDFEREEKLFEYAEELVKKLTK